MIPGGAHWRDALRASDNIGEVLTAATLSIARQNPELTGIFTVDWNQPALNGDGKLIDSAVIHALVRHFNGKNLSNANIDVLGRAYKYLTQMLATEGGPEGNIVPSVELTEKPSMIRCFAEKTNWQAYGMLKINMILHG